jgi:hypothetical protein
VIRPEPAAVTGESGLIATLEKALKDVGLACTRAQMRKAVKSGAASVAALLEELVKATAHPDGRKHNLPTLILAIDQVEELFQAEGAEEARTFLDLLRELVTCDSPALIVLFTIRSDSYEHLQTVESLRGLRQQMLSLPPMPKGRMPRSSRVRRGGWWRRSAR